MSLCNFFCRPSGLLHEVILIRAMVPACSWYYFSVLTPYTQMDPFHVRTGFGSICTCRALRTQATFPVEVLTIITSNDYNIVFKHYYMTIIFKEGRGT